LGLYLRRIFFEQWFQKSVQYPQAFNPFSQTLFWKKSQTELVCFGAILAAEQIGDEQLEFKVEVPLHNMFRVISRLLYLGANHLVLC
jgi:hypothetical protein